MAVILDSHMSHQHKAPPTSILYLTIAVLQSSERDWDKMSFSMWTSSADDLLRRFIWLDIIACVRANDWQEIILHSFYRDCFCFRCCLCWRTKCCLLCFFFFPSMLFSKWDTRYPNTTGKMAPCCWSWHQALLVVCGNQHLFVLCLMFKMWDLQRHLPFYTAL